MLLLNWWVATGILFLEIATVGKLVSLIIFSGWLGEDIRNSFKTFTDEVRVNILGKTKQDVYSEKFLLICIFLFSLFSTVISLVYSEIFLQIPCALCWWQRIFIYGIVVLSFVGMYQAHKEKNVDSRKLIQKTVLGNIFVFSVGGFLFGLYQHLEQIFALYGTHLPCPVSGADCSKMTIFEYGHITFPWTAVVLCAFFIVIILLQRKLK